MTDLARQAWEHRHSKTLKQVLTEDKHLRKLAKERGFWTATIAEIEEEERRGSQ